MKNLNVKINNDLMKMIDFIKKDCKVSKDRVVNEMLKYFRDNFYLPFKGGKLK